MSKNPVGRPTDYRPEMCEQAIEILKTGAEIEELGLALDVGYSTVYLWMEKHPEFMEAIKKGREYSKGWWMKEGREALRDKEFNYTGWYMNMKNRFGWKDKTENTHNVSMDESTERVRDATVKY